jgi:hypothetical protein
MLVFGVMAMALNACNCAACDEEALAPLDEAPKCNLGKNCKQAKSYKFGACRDDYCESDAECCPGTRCRTDFNTCWPHFLESEYECETEADCPDPAHACVATAIGDREPLPTCVFDRCNGDSDCPTGRSCFHSVCVATAPCGGGCPGGEICDVLTGQCSPLPSDGHSGCDSACGDSQMLVLKDPDAMSGELCCALECTCKGLPPIIPGNYGYYSDVAVAEGAVLVSAYDAQYGDLILLHYGKDGSLARLETVDGVPPGAPVVADPNGPRGGVGEIGENVGTHTSIGLDALGHARIAYHDVENGSLKVALWDGTAWAIHTVDAGSPDTPAGLFTDLSVDPNTGTLTLTYYVHNVAGVPGVSGPGTAVKLARSNSAAPQSQNDWSFTFVDQHSAFDACEGACTAGQACVLENQAPTCVAEATGCTPACGSVETCVSAGTDGAGAALVACRAGAQPPETGLPRGRGLFTRHLVDGSTTYVTYYDGIEGSLRLARIGAAGSPTIDVIDGAGSGTHPNHDVGRFADLTKLNNEIFIVYLDFTTHTLRTWQGTDPAAGGVFGIIDDGIATEAGQLQFVGAGSRVTLGSAGQPVVVYQDASSLDLQLATLNGATWTKEGIATDGARGFYSGLGIGAGTAYFVHVVAQLDSRGTNRSRLELLTRPAP